MNDTCIYCGKGGERWIVESDSLAAAAVLCDEHSSELRGIAVRLSGDALGHRRRSMGSEGFPKRRGQGQRIVVIDPEEYRKAHSQRPQGQ